MTMAICINCGIQKNGSFIECPSCGFLPKNKEDCAKSLILSDHYHKNGALLAISLDYESGNPPTIDEDWIKEIAEGIADSQYLEGGEDEDMGEDIQKIALIGVGGGGMKTVDGLIQQNSVMVEKSIVFNRNKLFLLESKADDKIKLNAAKNSPNIMIEAVHKQEANIKKLLSGIDAVVIVVGLGGLTGTYASPEISRIIKELGVIVWVVAVMPFEFEGKRRTKEAEKGLEQLSKFADGVRCVKNQELTVSGRSISMIEAFKPVDAEIIELTNSILNSKKTSVFIKDETDNVKATHTPIVDADFLEVSLDTCCSFCNEPLSKAQKFIFSSATFICHKCVSLCAQKLATKPITPISNDKEAGTGGAVLKKNNNDVPF